MSRVHAVYLSVRTEGGRESGCLTGDVGGRKEKRLWVRVALWRVVKGEINQVRAICGNGCCSVIRNPITQQLL